MMPQAQWRRRPSGIVVPPSETLSEAILADSPYAYYKLDETTGTSAADSSGNGRNGTYFGAYTLNQTGLITSEPASKSVFFSDTNDNTRMATPITANFTSALTMEAVIKPDAAGVDVPGVIWSKSSYFATTVADFPVSLTFNPSSGNIAMNLSSGDDFSTDAVLVTPDPLVFDEIYHVAGVYRANGQCELWINGVIVDSETIAFTISTNSQPWTLARHSETRSGGGVQVRSTET